MLRRTRGNVKHIKLIYCCRFRVGIPTTLPLMASSFCLIAFAIFGHEDWQKNKEDNSRRESLSIKVIAGDDRFAQDLRSRNSRERIVLRTSHRLQAIIHRQKALSTSFCFCLVKSVNEMEGKANAKYLDFSTVFYVLLSSWKRDLISANNCELSTSKRHKPFVLFGLMSF